MASAQPADFASLIGPVALRLYGEPNKRLSRANELRWGNNGARIVYPESGSFLDTEADAKGGTLDLIRHVTGGDKGDALAWLVDQGLIDDRTTIAPQRPSSAVRLDAGQRIVASFAFATDGVTHYRKHRIEPGRNGRSKDFAYDHPNGAGGWIAGRGDAEQIPFLADELRAAPAGSIIVMAEGEAKALKLKGWGFVASSIKDWRHEFGSYVAGKRVVILADNDEAGAKQAAVAKGKIEAAGAFAAILVLPRLQDAGDVLDWDGDAAELRFLVDSALAKAPRPISATPYVWCDPETIPERRWLFGRWLLRGTAAAAIAMGGIGKTTFLDSLALAVVAGRGFMGKTAWDGPGRVWLWNLEDDMTERRRSIQAAAKHHGLTAAEINGRLFVDSAMDGAGLCTAVNDAAGFRLIAPVYEAITAEMIARGIDLLIVDPFVSSHQVEENANSEIDAIAKAWARVAKDANASIILVHHTSKAGAHEVTALSGRGAVSLVNACRSALVLNRMDEQEAERFGIADDSERRRYFTVQDDKHNRAPAEAADWYRLASVPLGNGRDGGDSIGVAEPWSPPDPFDGLTGDHLYRVQLALADGAHREDWQSPAWAGIAVANVLGLDPKAKADRSRIRKLLSTWVEAGALISVERDDENRKPRKWIEVGRWQNDASAPPRNGGAEQGGADEASECSTTTPAPLGAVGWSNLPAAVAQTGKNGGGAARPGGPILAPGESDDDPVPGWDGER